MNNYFQTLTNNKFRVNLESFTFQEMLGPLVVLYLLYFIKRGIQLEEEQTLTV